MLDSRGVYQPNSGDSGRVGSTDESGGQVPDAISTAARSDHLWTPTGEPLKMDHPQPDFAMVYERLLNQRVCYLGRFETADDVQKALEEYGQVSDYSAQVPEGEVFAALWNDSEEPLQYELIYLNKSGTWVGSGPQSIGSETVVVWNPDTARLILLPQNGADAQDAATWGSYRSYSIVPDAGEVEAAQRLINEKRGGAFGIMRLHSPSRYRS